MRSTIYPEIGRIYVFGAGKGIQNVAKAIEDVLGETARRRSRHRQEGPPGHPGEDRRYPREGIPHPTKIVPGDAARILEITKGLTEKDLVFTCIGNGVSSLLTLPAAGLDHGGPAQDYARYPDRARA